MSATRTYTKRSRAAAEQATRAALLDAAEATFFERGWERTPLEAMAAQAGVTKQTLLRHFGSKDGLLAAAYERGLERVRAQRFSAPPGDVEAAIGNLVDHYEELGARALRLGAYTGGPGAAFAEAARALHRDWVRHAFRDRLAGVPSPVRDRLLAALVVVCDVHAWSILARDLGLPGPEVRATLITTVRRLLGEDA
jgi:AcrR family transcriptional regulator